MNYASVVVLLLSLGVVAGGCQGARKSTDTVASAAQSAAAATTVTSPVQSQVTKVVFIDKQEACDCTRARVTKGWDALQAALGGKSTPTVERLYMDTQPDQVGPYREMRPMMAVPALYFLNASGTLVDQLQGELTTQQIQAVLGSGR
jgi:hypothetical protein